MGERSGDRLAGGLDLGGIAPNDDYVLTLHNSFAYFRVDIILGRYESFEKLPCATLPAVFSSVTSC
jgi:hypothetical protein